MEDEGVIQYERSLGKGAYGSVFLIRNELNGERYALKRIDFNGNEEECIQARKEAEILSKLNHGNVLKYIESFEDEDTLNIVTEFCEGGDLEDYLRERKGRQLAEQHIALWIYQVVLGLQYIHEQNILHRDLKTKNLFLTDSLNIKVGDLGIAKVLDGEKAKAMTFVGTLTYMSPEQFQHKPYNHKADVWSFGCCAFEMVALRRAFNSPVLFQNVQNIQNGKLPEFPDGYTASLKDLVFSMMRTEPKQRPSATKLLQHSLLQEASNWKIQDVLVLSEMETKGKPNKSARLRRRRDVAEGKFAKTDLRRSMSWKGIRMEIDKHEQEVLSHVINKLTQVTLSRKGEERTQDYGETMRSNGSGFYDDTMRVNECEENDETMRVNRTYTGSGDEIDTMRVNRTYKGNSDDTMRVNQTYRSNNDDTMRVNQTIRSTNDDTMRVNNTYTGTGDYDDTMRVNNTYTGTGDYGETLGVDESNDYGDTFVTARSESDTLRTFLSNDSEEYYDASESLSSMVATELETLLHTSPDSLSSLKINMVSKDLIEEQGPGGNTLQGVESSVLASLEGTVDISRNPIAAARTMVEGLKKNLTPFDGFGETEAAPVQTDSSSPDGGKKKKKRVNFLARKAERKKSETTSPVGSLTFADSEKATYRNVKEGDDVPAANMVPKEKMEEEEEEEPVRMRPKHARSARGTGYIPFDRRKTTDSIRGILAIMSVPENKGICDDQAALLRREITNDLGKEMLEKCIDLMTSIQDDNILQVVLQDLIGPRKYEEYKMHLFFLRMFELNSLASY
ncbi:probable serine/threonine-protein kinase pXi isoform X2 [Mizuhopecten yessoensis]|uniref:probable serine/threonine-protein kinase pXi isoform X2 n=1 Tax=Mizuhopecten yessoensis TaxID=6573 RepID=UPI000B45D5DA|nr:probable serine/threonine-protein kinase pXi isoform X2 [Mizuhopecten yessoensis]